MRGRRESPSGWRSRRCASWCSSSRTSCRSAASTRTSDNVAAMRWLALLVLAACGSGSTGPQPPKRPNTELIVGEFERKPPDGTTVARFRGDGSVTIAHDRGSLDKKNLATGTFTLEGDQLTLQYTGGEMCGGGGGPGTYKVVV